MEILDRRKYYQAAKEALQGASYDPKKLILIHTGAAAAVSLVVSILVYILEQQLAGTTGLGGLGTRSILMTVQTVLQFLPVLLMPFWTMGYVLTLVNLAENKRTGPGELAEGFFRFGSVLRLELLMAALYAVLGFAATQLGGTVFLWTPWAAPMMNAALAFMANPESAALEQALYAAAEQAALPMLLIVGAVFIGLSLPFFYRFRMARLHLMANPGKGALAAMKESAAMTRFRRMALFRLDLSFWWFYLLEVLAAAVSAADMVLTLAGVTLPIPAAAQYFGCVVLSLGLQLLLHYWRKNEVYVTYAKVYLDLRKEI